MVRFVFAAAVAALSCRHGGCGELDYRRPNARRQHRALRREPGHPRRGRRPHSADRPLRRAGPRGRRQAYRPARQDASSGPDRHAHAPGAGGHRRLSLPRIYRQLLADRRGRARRAHARRRLHDHASRRIGQLGRRRPEAGDRGRLCRSARGSSRPVMRSGATGGHCDDTYLPPEPPEEWRRKKASATARRS